MQPNLSLYPMSAVHSAYRERTMLHVDYVRQPLMMKAGRVHGFLDVHAEIDHTDQDVGDGGDDRGTARRTQNQNSLPSLSTMVGVMDDSGRLPGPMALAGP